MSGSEEESLQKRRMVEKGADLRSSSREGRCGKTVQDNSQAIVSKIIREFPVEEDGLFRRFAVHDTDGEGGEDDRHDEFLNEHDEEKVRDEDGDGGYLYSKGAEEDERERKEGDDDVIDNIVPIPPDARQFTKHEGNEKNIFPLYREGEASGKR